MLETRPTQTVHFPPDSGTAYRVRTGDSWESVARANGLTAWALIEFNFPVVREERNFQTKCRMVNWLLRQYVGCTRSSDGNNYRFDSADSPGTIYIPFGPVPTVYTHRVRLHFRSLTLTDVEFDRIFRSTQRVYAQYGIRIDFASGASLGLSEAEADRLQTVDGSCAWNITSGEYADVQGLAGRLPANEILVCYVRRFSASIRGCGGHAPNRPACIVAAHGNQFSTGHEVGHVLLGSSFRPVHEASTDNLLFTSGSTASLPSLTDAQVAQMKRSTCCVSI